MGFASPGNVGANAVTPAGGDDRAFARAAGMREGRPGRNGLSPYAHADMHACPYAGQAPARQNVAGNSNVSRPARWPSAAGESRNNKVMLPMHTHTADTHSKLE
eukprot:CAMPEP_0197902978 /NCGR_PEP_ID=MMETSP1439-20131203/54825_1 /TAXON_ID=66791 /ORGANISM="Gonyaulax spinifera, Strain CCMP409" /LENGTH=103 /DNA_ID=CAMNT_0043524059 /DNA_START=15 /DNA_END=324 /DNA_ORIENTATION=-